jgi:putative flippase GtrA
MKSLRIKSLLVSLLTTVIDAGLFALSTLILVGAWLVWARWVCGALGAVCNFVLNRRWAFHARHPGWGRDLGRYALTATASVTLATAVWCGLRAATGWDVRLLHPLSLGLVWFAFTFPMLRGWVFRRGIP